MADSVSLYVDGKLAEHVNAKTCNESFNVVIEPKGRYDNFKFRGMVNPLSPLPKDKETAGLVKAIRELK